MNQRERAIETLTFGNPDRIPLQPGGPRESTRKRWREEGMPEGVEPTQHIFQLLGIEQEPTQRPVQPGVDFRMIPQFEEKVLEHKQGHYVVQDWKGNICEISDEFDITYLRQAKDFVTRKWLKCPVENEADWEDMKKRYIVDAPGRFPGDFDKRCKEIRKRDYFLKISFHGPFWQLREWCGFEGLCMMMIEEPELVEDMANFWRDFIAEILERIFEGCVPDQLHFSEDMAYKEKAMISPDMARRYCQPSWDKWTQMAKNAGVPLVGIDSDGYIGELIPLWIDSGVNCCDPIEVAAGCDINEFRKQFGHKMAYRGGVDKRCIAKGGKVIEDELNRLEPVVKDGGYIPSCDHGVPSDISWQDFIHYTRLLAEMTGWL